MENDSRNRKVNDNSLPVHLIGTSIQSKIIACKHTEKTWKSKNFNGCQSIIRGRKRGKGENASLMGVTNPVKERKKYLEKIKIINSFHSILNSTYAQIKEISIHTRHLRIEMPKISSIYKPQPCQSRVEVPND